MTVDFELENLQRQTFDYFLYETNPDNGLVIDKTSADWPAILPLQVLRWPAIL